MIFTPSFTATESADGKTILFTNVSNFDNNSEGYSRAAFTTNQLVLTDAYGAVIDTIDFPITGDGQDKITYPINTPQWINANLQLAGPATYSTSKSFAFYRLFMEKYKSILVSGSKRSFKDKNFSVSTYFKDVAVYSIDNAIEFQENIDAAVSYINTVQ